MKRYLFAVICTLCFCCAGAQTTWDGEPRVPVDFARTIIERLRANYWGKMRLPNDEIVQPLSDEERMSTPIPEKLALSLVTAGALAAHAERCKLDTREFERRVQRAASDTYPELKQIMFSVTLLSMSKMIFQKQGVEQPPCKPDQRAGFAQLLGIK